MLKSKLIGLFALSAVVVFATLQFSSAAPTGPSVLQQPLVVFVVRHAEKEGSGRDPVLSEAGQNRAKVLAATLKDANLNHIHSSNYKRTLQTAAATAEATNLNVSKYDPRKLNQLAASLKKAGGRHLVVGHSNTTPELVKLLGGDPVSAIDDASEYDRLYIVTMGESEPCVSVLLRYGASSAVTTATETESR